VDFELPWELQKVQEIVRAFVDKELIPLEKTLPDPEIIPPDVRADLDAKVKAMGLWAAAVPQAEGGGGLGVLGQMVIREQVCRAIVGDARDERGFGGFPWPVLYFCTPDQKARYLAPIVRGEKTMFFAMSEPGAGNDAGSIRTTAVRDGNEWVLNGSKTWITGAGSADFGVVFALTDPVRRTRGGVSFFFVDRGTRGMTISPPHRTMGAALIHDVFFDHCRIPAEALIGKVGEAFELAQKTLTISRLMQAPISLGLAQRALELATAYAKERVTFGQPLAQREAVQWMLAESAAEIRAARLMAYSIAWRLDHGEEPRREAAIAKVFAGEMGSRVIDRAIQIHGGLGVSRELPLERMYRDQRSFRITEGGTEVQRWIIARELLSPRRAAG
jgi:acyl-CoA dehydrogenase